MENEHVKMSRDGGDAAVNINTFWEVSHAAADSRVHSVSSNGRGQGDAVLGGDEPDRVGGVVDLAGQVEQPAMTVPGAAGDDEVVPAGADPVGNPASAAARDNSPEWAARALC
ncbi:hypothetical protein [Saccharopolyspora sp. SCSIO 74807]|uniref:hypothetical protein n=1 Tax=Saccharopolyspora sp. SCSIO 74807 TaxID=3118084 RepID=UPI0030D4FD4F